MGLWVLCASHVRDMLLQCVRAFTPCGIRGTGALLLQRRLHVPAVNTCVCWCLPTAL